MGSKVFHELEIWQEGYELLLEISKIATLLPDYQRFALVVQIHKSANGIIANIAEAHGRFHYADKIRVLYIARGELVETRSHLQVMKGFKYISEEKYKEIDARYEQLQIALNRYIKYLTEKSIHKN